jgi:type I restriction enzyme R subunit
MSLLRNPSFQDLLVNYPRPKRSFILAEGYEDQVSSSLLIRGADGREHKPEDYLKAFSTFVRDNPARVQAIRILLDRPKEWGTEALSELRSKLAAAPERFTFDALEKAHRLRYDRALVDIISMVKHAAHEEEPLLTAEERVGHAFDRLTATAKFAPDQQRWLVRIREHLVANLSIDEEDFENVPVLQNAGGWGNANRAFDKKLPAFLKKLNEAVAA